MMSLGSMTFPTDLTMFLEHWIDQKFMEAVDINQFDPMLKLHQYEVEACSSCGRFRPPSHKNPAPSETRNIWVCLF